MGQVGDAYAGTRQRVTELLAGADGSVAVPACPAWTVKDVLAHVAGVVDDILAGRLDGVATEPWTDAQVVARRDASLDDVLAEWNEKAPQIEAIVDGFGASGRQLVFDTVTHEHDLRGALDRPGAETSDAIIVGSGFIVPGFVSVVAHQGLPPIVVEATDGETWASAPDETPAARLRASRFDLVRAFSGRRSLDQVAAMDWDGDASTYFGAFTFGPFRPSTVALTV